MNEDLLYYIWKSKKLYSLNLHSTSGKSIKIIHPGNRNHNQGPDFLFAKLEIDGVIWAGQVEMHVKTSDWFKHQHQEDPNYSNIILHVVWINDLPIEQLDEKFPVLTLSSFISENDYVNYTRLMQEHQEIPCLNLIKSVDPLYIESQIDSSSIERFQSKSERFNDELIIHQFDWDALFYKWFCHYMVSPVNVDAMDRLTRMVDYKMILKIADDISNLESTLFVVSSLLPTDSSNEYINALIENGKYLSNKYQLQHLAKSEWYFLRMRPAHFPTIRIAQIASFFNHETRPLQKILETAELKGVEKLFDISTSEYWTKHYHFSDLEHAYQQKRIGKSTISVLLINVICPLLFKYADYHQKPELREKSLLWLEQVKAENNRFTRLWTQTGFHQVNARQSQGILHQLKEYCSKKKCLECKVGHKLIGSS